MNSLIRGQKVGLTKVNTILTDVKIGLGWELEESKEAFDLDVLALLIDASGKLNNLQDIVYYNNLASQNGAVRLTSDHRTEANAGDDEEISISLKEIPANLTKIVIAINIYEAFKKKQNFDKVLNSYARIVNKENGQELFRYDLTKEFSTETTVIIGEIYLHKNEWKFAAIGRGTNEGISGLCALYDFQITSSSFLKVPLKNKVEPQKSLNSNTGIPASINLSKIELKKSGDKINLNKTSNPLGELLINLNWNQKSSQSKQGVFSSLFSSKSSVDLDLGCLFELEDGYIGAVQALGNSFGDLNNEPYIHLDQDDRTGASVGGENLRINGNRVAKFKRILVFAYIYEGVANWSEVDGIVTLKQQNGPDIVVRLDEHRNGKGMCAVALLENVNDQTFSLKKIARYFTGHREMDEAFNWGIRWTAGSK